MEFKPLVSIVIPVYNGSDYMREAIDSALSQTYENIEVLVINDGSKDDGKTDEIARSYGDKIRYFSKENGGVSSALNLGIKEMRGEFFSWLSHDDVYDIYKIETQINDVLKLKNEGEDFTKYLFYCRGLLMNAEGKIIRKRSSTSGGGKCISVDMLKRMFSGKVPGGCGLLIPRQMFDTVGLFDESMRYMQDVFMWEKAFISGYNFYSNEKVLVKTRIHPNQDSARHKENGRKDREKVGKYLAENLKGLRSSDGESLIKIYMFSCMKSNNLNIGNMIYKDLVSSKKLTFKERLKAKLLKYYGKRRRILSMIYYKVLFNSAR